MVSTGARLIQRLRREKKVMIGLAIIAVLAFVAVSFGLVLASAGTAAAILAWRSANGVFTSVDQLVEVDGIGPATLAKLRPLVTV